MVWILLFALFFGLWLFIIFFWCIYSWNVLFVCLKSYFGFVDIFLSKKECFKRKKWKLSTLVKYCLGCVVIASILIMFCNFDVCFRAIRYFLLFFSDGFFICLRIKMSNRVHIWILMYPKTANRVHKCVKLWNKISFGKYFHIYFNPYASSVWGFFLLSEKYF